MIRKKNKKYVFGRRHSTNDDELPILQFQNPNASTAPDNPNARPQSARRSLTLFENGGSEANSEFRDSVRTSEPENLSHSSPALLNDTTNEQGQNQSVSVEAEVTPPPLPPRRPPPRSINGGLGRQASTRSRFSVLTRSNNSISPLDPSVTAWPLMASEQNPTSIIRNVDGLMSIIDYGPPRQNENSDPSTSSSPWRRFLLNSQTLHTMSQFDDPPPSYEEVMQEKEKEGPEHTS